MKSHALGTLKIYADRKYLPAGFHLCQLLYPFWGFRPEPVGSPRFRPLLDSPELNLDRLRRYVERAPEIFELGSLSASDVAVLPFDWRYVEDAALLDGDPSRRRDARARAERLAAELALEAAGVGKPLCVFFSHDSATATVPGDAVFRRSLEASSRRAHEFALPLWVADELGGAPEGDVPLRVKPARPRVGFVGYDPLAPRRRRRLVRSRDGATRAGRIAAGPPHHGAFEVRSRALDLLEGSNELHCEFVRRRQWWNGAVTDTGFDARLARRSHEELIANMIGSDYVLCPRGEGNCSYRFYETLSCGRIPIFVNTDCVLPHDRWIDWKRYCVWVEEDELPQIASIVLEFHERLSPGEFEDLQLECRRLWLDWLSPEGFFGNLHRYFA